MYKLFYMYTHVMIEDVSHNPHNCEIKLKKGDFATLKLESIIAYNMKPAYIFAEHSDHKYDQRLFVPLPPQKIICVSIPETIKESVPETILN